LMLGLPFVFSLSNAVNSVYHSSSQMICPHCAVIL
jgi:hypothetical protein